MRKIASTAEVQGVLGVVAHPDDESFGIGAVLAWLHRRGIPASVLVFTRGEASTLGAAGKPHQLGARRADELACASRILGLSRYVLHSYPDGHLEQVPLDERVQKIAEAGEADVLLAFDETGITGHLDHIAATEAAGVFAVSHGVPLYLWTLPEEVVATLNARFDASFRGRPAHEITITLDVLQERQCQWEAIQCHQSQAGALNIVRARLELLGSREYLIERYRGGHKHRLFR